MTIKSILQEGNALHTGEVVGSIPTAPTNLSMQFSALSSLHISSTRQFAEERRMNMAHVNLQNPCRPFD